MPPAGALPGSSTGWPADAADTDLPPELLADPDSQFIDIDGIGVHYKEALPDPDQGLPYAYQQPQEQHGSGQQEVAHGAVHLAQAAEAEGRAPARPSAGAEQSEAAAGSGAWETFSSAEQPKAEGGSSQLVVGSCQGQPPACPAPGDSVAVVLVHGFGGGVFAWRHILQPLSSALGVRVVAFDRPGFGELSCTRVAGMSASAAWLHRKEC